MSSHSPGRTPAGTPARRSSRLEALRDRLARSSRVFLAGVIVACGIEVLVDWNATLFEINVLRDRMRERGQSYVAILAHAAQPAAAARDGAELGRLSVGLFDDQDVAFVRFADARGASLFERLRPGYDDAFAARKGRGFVAYYAGQMARDQREILRDPDGLRARMANSRHRDAVQAWNDFVGGIVQHFAGAPPRPAGATTILYQDRLRTPAREHDADTTYALGTVVDPATPRGEPLAVALVAFDMGRVNAAIRTKYLKGAGMVVFFVGLILVQNVSSRRDKLKLLDLERRYASAKRAVHEALPAARSLGSLRVAGALAQAPGAVDALVWDASDSGGALEVMAVDPQGDGIDAAAVALHVLQDYRARRAAGPAGTLDEEVAALGRAAGQIPLTRPVGVLLLRVRLDNGEVQGVCSPMGGVRVLGGSMPLDDRPREGALPPGVVGPLRELRGELPERATLLVACDGLAEGARVLDVGAVAAFFERVARAGAGEPETLARDAVTWARGRSSALLASDLLVVTVARGEASV